MSGKENRSTTSDSHEDATPHKTCYGFFDIPFDIEEAQKSNTLISGANSSGKTRLACGIVSLLKHFNWQIVTFDSVGVWREISDIRYYYKVYPEYLVQARAPIPTEQSIIYDLSLLKPSEQTRFVNTMLEQIWNFRVQTQPKDFQLICLEEAHLYMRSVRTNVAESILRLMSAGRNWRTRCLAVVPDLALLDSSFIRLASQRYHGKLLSEENGKRKFTALYGKDYTRICIEALDVGDFLYVLGDKKQVFHAPLFTPKTKPIAYTEPQKPSILQRIKRLFT